jgi:hypothetical protein
MKTISKKKLDLLEKLQHVIAEDVDSLKYYLQSFNGARAALVARNIQLNAETVQQYLFPEGKFKPDAEVTDETVSAKSLGFSEDLGALKSLQSKSLGVLRINDEKEV